MMKLQKPEFIVDLKKVNTNINNIISRCDQNNILFRPHFKTHQSAEIGEIFREKGVDKIAVSSVSMAEYFIKKGWNDITIAFPFNILETEKINEINKKVNINLMIDNNDTLKYLTNNIDSTVGIFIKIDLGYHRSGIDYYNLELIQNLMFNINSISKFDFKGFIIHSGDTYHLTGKESIIENFSEKTEKINYLRNNLKIEQPFLISYGDTPTSSIISEFQNIDELRPGNFVFFDLMQFNIGSCTIEDIAVAVSAPVVSLNKQRNEVVVYCGSVHMSKESIILNNQQIYGIPAFFNQSDFSWTNPINGAYLKNLSQEHGIISMPDEIMNKLKIGDILAIIPVHSCLTADNFRYYIDTNGNTISKFT